LFSLKNQNDEEEVRRFISMIFYFII